MDLLLLALVSVVLLTALATLNYLQSRSQTTLLVTMLRERETTIQSLLNQLRTTDPFSLQSLNAATLSSQTLTDPNEYVSQSDEAEVMRFGVVGVGDELTQEDLEAFGSQYFDKTNTS